MKRIVKEGWYKGELLSSAKDKMKQAKSLLVQASNDIRRAIGEDSWLFSRVDSNANDIDDTLYAFDNETGNIKYDDEIVDESRAAYLDEQSEWFDKYGNILKPIPMACILDCSGKGRVDDSVQYWLEELNFCTGFPVNKAVEWLHEFGAWEDLDLLGEVAQADINDKAAQAKMTQWIRKQGTEMDNGGWYNAPFFALKTLASRVLWIFCCDIKEQAEETTDEELEEVGLPIDVDEWKNAEWELFQNEFSYLSLNN